MHVPTTEIGVRAARRIVALVEGAETTPDTDLTTRFVLRDSLQKIAPL